MAGWRVVGGRRVGGVAEEWQVKWHWHASARPDKVQLGCIRVITSGKVESGDGVARMLA